MCYVYRVYIQSVWKKKITSRLHFWFWKYEKFFKKKHFPMNKKYRLEEQRFTFWDVDVLFELSHTCWNKMFFCFWIGVCCTPKWSYDWFETQLSCRESNLFSPSNMYTTSASYVTHAYMRTHIVYVYVCCAEWKELLFQSIDVEPMKSSNKCMNLAYWYFYHNVFFKYFLFSNEL